MTIKKLLLGGALVAGLVACGDKSSDQAGGAPSAEESATTSSLLARVPADTPYLFMNTQGMSDELYNHYMQQYSGMMDMMAEMFNEISESDDISESGAESALDSMGRLYGLLADADDVDAMREKTGLAPNGLGMLYGAGVFPVIAMQADDPEKVRATMTGLMADADGNSQTQAMDVDGVSVNKLSFADDHLGAYWAVNNGQLVITALPVQLEDSYLSNIFGDGRPDSAFDKAEVDRINSTYGFSGYGSGFVDLVGVYDRLVNAGTPEGAALADMLADEPDNFLAEPACVSEMRGLLNKAPRMYAGVTALDTEQTAMRTVFTLDDSIRSGFAGMVGSAPIADDPGTLFNFGMNLNLAGVRDFVAAQSSNVMQSPYTCSHLAGLNDAAEQMNTGVNQPIPPLVGTINGMRFSMTSLNLDALEGDNPMQAAQSMQGNMLLYTDQPSMLIGMGQLMLPFLAEMDLTPGAEPQLLSADMIPMDIGPAYVAASDSAIGVALGEGQQDGLTSLLNAGQSGEPAMFSFGMDYSLYAQFMEFADSMDDGFDVDTEEGDAAEQERLEAIMRNFYQTYAELGYTFGTVRVNDQGLVIDQAVYNDE